MNTLGKRTGWRPIPLSLKILFLVFILWIFGSVLNMPTVYVSGLPFFGVFIFGISATLVILLLDIIGPLIFMFALLSRKSWGSLWALSYISIFILNNLVALLTVRGQLGLIQISIPMVINIVFFIVVYLKRSYFRPISA